MVAAVGIGLLIGLLLGLLGGGGSILAVPALMYGVGQPLDQAIPTSLLVIGLSALAGALARMREGQVHWRLVAVFGVTGAAAAFAGTAVNARLPVRAVLVGFAAVMIAAGVGMLRNAVPAGAVCTVTGGRIDWRRCLPRSAGSGVAVGFLTGLFGVGGGFLIIPALVLLLGLDMTAAVGTSLVIVVFNSAAGLTAHLGHARIDVGIAVAFTAAAVVGALAASRMGTRLPTARLQRSFAYFVFAVAIFVLAQALFNSA
ncbi:MAG: sulfite exporter TauE/SafE family protein [Jatrophihabitantaceae bacterium]